MEVIDHKVPGGECSIELSEMLKRDESWHWQRQNTAESDSTQHDVHKHT